MADLAKTHLNGDFTMTEQLERGLARCSPGMTARSLSISLPTLAEWRQRGKIGAEHTPAGRWLYDVRPFVKDKAD